MQWLQPATLQPTKLKLQHARSPSNLRPTTRECLHLVKRGYFRSRDKDGGHNIRSAISENHMLHANFTVLFFIEPELLPIEVLHWVNRDFRPFFATWPWLWPITFIYELTCIPWRYNYERSTSRLSNVIVRQTDRQTRPKFWSKTGSLHERSNWSTNIKRVTCFLKHRGVIKSSTPRGTM